MSGIFGFKIIGNNKDIDVEENIKRMKVWNEAYGTEKQQIYSEEDNAFGCCCEKLSSNAICGETVLLKNNKIAVIDVVLYNAEEIMEKCDVIEKMSDEELLFLYIDKYGFDALKTVNGDFAGAIYDKESEILTLFRDHMGIRPLFYYEKNGEIVFSTDIRGITALPWVDVSVNELWVYKTLCGYAIDGIENTEFANIFCVQNGGYISFKPEQSGLRKEKKTYWQVGQKKIRMHSEEEYIDKLRFLITDSIRRRLNATSDIVGAELSGGLDSGVIDILINRLGRKGIYFSWSPDPKEVPMAPNDERLIVEEICKQENISCHYRRLEENLSVDSTLAENMRRILGELDISQSEAFRYVFPPYINTLKICDTSEFVRKKGARVVFTGHGGDEGVSHRSNVYEMFYHKEYYHFFRYMWSTTYGKKGRVYVTLKDSYKKIRDLKERKNIPFRSPFGTPVLVNKEFGNRFMENEMPVSTFTFDPKIYVKGGGSRNRLDVVALLGAYCGVRYMVPFLDYRVIDFAVSIPRHMYLKRRRNRYIYREAFKDIMPKSLYSLCIKENNSWQNRKKNPNWYEEFVAKKHEVVQKLDRQYWSKYINFEEVDAWLLQGKSTEENMTEESNILMNLFYCAMLQNLVEKSRDIK